VQAAGPVAIVEGHCVHKGRLSGNGKPEQEILAEPALRAPWLGPFRETTEELTIFLGIRLSNFRQELSDLRMNQPQQVQPVEECRPRRAAKSKTAWGRPEAGLRNLVRHESCPSHNWIDRSTVFW
jgi:hypothetical protein